MKSSKGAFDLQVNSSGHFHLEPYPKVKFFPFEILGQKWEFLFELQMTLKYP